MVYTILSLFENSKHYFAPSLATSENIKSKIEDSKKKLNVNTSKLNLSKLGFDSWLHESITNNSRRGEIQSRPSRSSPISYVVNGGGISTLDAWHYIMVMVGFLSILLE